MAASPRLRPKVSSLWHFDTPCAAFGNHGPPQGADCAVQPQFEQWVRNL